MVLCIFLRNTIFLKLIRGKLVLLMTRGEVGQFTHLPKKITKGHWNKMISKTLKANLLHGTTEAQIDELVDNYEGFGF